jgi:hypothetical protein
MQNGITVPWLSLPKPENGITVPWLSLPKPENGITVPWPLSPKPEDGLSVPWSQLPNLDFSMESQLEVKSDRFGRSPVRLQNVG